MERNRTHLMGEAGIGDVSFNGRGRHDVGRVTRSLALFGMRPRNRYNRDINALVDIFECPIQVLYAMRAGHGHRAQPSMPTNTWLPSPSRALPRPVSGSLAPIGCIGRAAVDTIPPYQAIIKSAPSGRASGRAKLGATVVSQMCALRFNDQPTKLREARLSGTHRDV